MNNKIILQAVGHFMLYPAPAFFQIFPTGGNLLTLLSTFYLFSSPPLFNIADEV